MIEMFVSGRRLLLPDNIQVRVEMNHPAFETDCVPVSVVYNFDLPARGNEEVFNYANQVETAGKYREYDWRMSYHGIPLLRGRLILQRVSDVFRCAASIKELPVDFADRNITDFELQPIGIPESTMSAFVDRIRAGNAREIAFPQIVAPLLYGEEGSSANPGFGAIINRPTPLENTMENRNTVIPLFHLAHVLRMILQTENYAIDFSRMAGFINELLLFNNYTLDAFPDDYYTFSNQEGQTGLFLTPTVDKYGCISETGMYVVKEPGEYDITVVVRGKFTTHTQPEKKDTLLRLEIVYTDESNPTGPGITKEIARNNVQYISQTPDSPHDFININHTQRFTPGVEKKFRFRLLSEIVNTIPQAHRLYEITFGYVEIKRIQGSGANDGEPDKNKYAREILPVNHLPEITVGDLLVSQKQTFGMVWFFDNNTARIQAILARDLLASRALDLTSLCVDRSMDITVTEPTAYELKYGLDETKIEGYELAGTYNYLSEAPPPKREKLLIRVLNLNCYYESRIIDEIGFDWRRLGDTYTEFKTHARAKKETVDIKARPLGMTRFGGNVYPYFDEQGVSPMFLPGTTKTDKLILLRRTSPLSATTTNYTDTGIVQPGELTFNFDGENGLYNQLLRGWYDFISVANEYTYDFMVTTEDLLRILQLFRPQDAPASNQVRRVRIGNQVYLPKQFTFELTNAGIKCQAKLMKNDGNSGTDTGV